MQNHDYIERFLDGVRQVTEQIDRAELDRAIEMIFSVWKSGNTIYTCGNGGSASTATHSWRRRILWTSHSG